MEKQVTITRKELIEKTAQATSNMMEKVSEKGGGEKAFALMLIGGILSSELVDVIFGKEEKYS